MNKLIPYLLFVSFFLSSVHSVANSNNNWDIYYEDAKVRISYQKQECDFDSYFDQEFLVIKIENLSSNTISVEWDNKIWYDESCVNCEQDSPEFRKKIRIESGKTINGNCYEQNDLQIFSRFTEKLEDMPLLTQSPPRRSLSQKNISL